MGASVPDTPAHLSLDRPHSSLSAKRASTLVTADVFAISGKRRDLGVFRAEPFYDFYSCAAAQLVKIPN